MRYFCLARWNAAGFRATNALSHVPCPLRDGPSDPLCIPLSVSYLRGRRFPRTYQVQSRRRYSAAPVSCFSSILGVRCAAARCPLASLKVSPPVHAIVDPAYRTVVSLFDAKAHPPCMSGLTASSQIAAQPARWRLPVTSPYPQPS